MHIWLRDLSLSQPFWTILSSISYLDNVRSIDVSCWHSSYSTKYDPANQNHSWVASRDDGAIEVSRLVLSALKSSPLVVHFNLAGRRRKIVSLEVSSQVSTISRIFDGGSYSDWSACDQSEIAVGRNLVQSSDFAPTISATFIFGFSSNGDVTLSMNK